MATTIKSTQAPVTEAVSVAEDVLIENVEQQEESAIVDNSEEVAETIEVQPSEDDIVAKKIVGLSKSDRRFLKNYQSPNP